MNSGPWCSYKNCDSTRIPGGGPSFHKFPVHDSHRCTTWIANSGNEQLTSLDTNLLKNKVVCEKHFDPACFRDPHAMKKFLVWNAIPIPHPEGALNILPKKIIKQQVASPELRTGTRRAASKEALKQLKQISESEIVEEAVETMILSDDDDVQISNDIIISSKKLCTCGAVAKSGYQCTVCKTLYHASCGSRVSTCCGVPLADVTDQSKRKYGNNRKKSFEESEPDVVVVGTVGNLSSRESTLNLEVWREELTPIQLQYRAKVQRELSSVTEKIDNLLKSRGAEVIFEGDTFSAFEFEGTPTCLPNAAQILATTSSVKPIAPAPPKPVIAQISTPPVAKSTTAIATTLNSNVQPSATLGLSFVVDPRSGQVVGTVTPNSTTPLKPTTTPATRKRTRGVSLLSPSPSQPKIAKIGNTPASTAPPLTPFSRTAEVSASKSQNGNTPNAKSLQASTPSVAVVDLTADDNNKPSADSKEVSFNKIQGKTFPSLVVVARPNLRVPPVASPLDRSKLDMRVKSVLVYQPSKFTEWLIQQGLVKSEQFCTVHVLNKLKLGMYSDAAKFPFSGGYVWISDCCPQRFVSVFSGSIFEGSPHPPSIIIKLMYHWSCQTNVQNVIQWVKVENLYVKGLYTWLRAVCTVALHTHVDKLGGPGVKVEIGVISLGTTSQDGNQRQVKVEVLGILETDSRNLRLRAVEPLTDTDKNYKKRFSKILEPLFAWVHPESIIMTDHTVDKSSLHSMGFLNVQQTNAGNGNHRIMDYLRKIVPRMFQNTLSLLSRQIIQQFLDELVWREWFGTTPSEAFDNVVLHLSEQTRAYARQALMVKLNKVATNPFRNWSISHLLNQLNEQPAVEPPSKRIRRTKQALPNTAVPIQNFTAELLKPAKPITPDFPELMVPLEHYYYGTIDGVNALEDIDLAIRCHICKEQFTNNIKLMKHYFMHAHNSSCLYQCHYCLAGITSKENLDVHIQEKHPSETKVGQEYACVICETQYGSTYLLGKHMSSEHRPSELPYQCGSCNFRCSSHKEAIDHFHNTHENQGVVQCPFCLKSTVVITALRALPQRLHYFLQHLQKHQRKSVAKKCGKCTLWFIQKDGINNHLKMHDTQRRKAGLRPWPVQQNGIMVPKSISDYVEEEEEIDISKLIIDVPDIAVCKECNKKLTPSHYQSLLSCSNENCQYVTCCKKAMDKHVEECKNFKLDIPLMQLPFEMYCVCGHKDDDGNSMAKHLAVCERNSAYPSSDAAKAATVTHSMLDVLGLVRRPEEPIHTIDSDTEGSNKDSNSKNEAVPETEDKTDVEKDKMDEDKPLSNGEEGIKSPKKVTEKSDVVNIDSDEDDKDVDETEKIESEEEPNTKDVSENDKVEDPITNEVEKDHSENDKESSSEKNDDDTKDSQSEKNDNDDEDAVNDTESNNEDESNDAEKNNEEESNDAEKNNDVESEVQNDKGSISDKNDDEMSSSEVENDKDKSDGGTSPMEVDSIEQINDKVPSQTSPTEDEPEDVLMNDVSNDTPLESLENEAVSKKINVNNEMIDNLEQFVGEGQNDQIMQSEDVDGLLKNIIDTECQKGADLSEVLLAN